MSESEIRKILVEWVLAEKNLMKILKNQEDGPR